MCNTELNIELGSIAVTSGVSSPQVQCRTDTGVHILSQMLSVYVCVCVCAFVYVSQ